MPLCTLCPLRFVFELLVRKSYKYDIEHISLCYIKLLEQILSQHQLKFLSPNPPSPITTDQYAVVTFTIPCTLVTILGLICAFGGISPLCRSKGLQPSSNFTQLADVLASAFIGYQLMLIVETQ